MTADVAAAEMALLKALDTGKAPPLAILVLPQYRRELRTRTMDSVIVMEVDKRGYRRYKHRGPRPKLPPPPADAEGIKQALTKLIAPSFTVQAVEDRGPSVSIHLILGGNNYDNEKNNRCY